MKEKLTKIYALALAFMLMVVTLVACKPQTPDHSSSSEEYSSVGETRDDLDLSDRPENTNVLVIYWTRGNGVFEGCDMWYWYDGKDGSGHLYEECDYGVRAIMYIPVGVEKVGFIARTDCSEPGGTSWGTATKDFSEDRYAILTGEITEIYLKEKDGAQYASKDGGKTLEMIKLLTSVSITSFTTLKYNLTPATTITSLDEVKVTANGQPVEIESITNLGKKATTGVINLKEKVDLSKKYEVTIPNYDGKVCIPMEIFDSEEFVENYTYDGDDLGATVTANGTTFKLWAPTASAVKLNLFDSGNEGVAYKSVDMHKGDKGIWYLNENCGHGTYYTYSVTTAEGTQEAVDPYARTAGVNGNRGMVVDLDATDPLNFQNDTYYKLESYNKASLWEVHVRDFSNKIESSKYKGKFLAFTETGLTNSHGISVGIDHVKNLGVSHIHLLPSYDFATVDESDKGDPFNWGYDPKNYNIPEGSYSTDPYHGEVRVKEFKQMVQGIHAQGLGVVMDVVYNHTYDGNSFLNKVVPGYYYRYTASGALSNGSGCGNETASERTMYRKYMVESVVYWAKEYHVDGFRFDLMALHDIETMQAIERALHEINPSAIIYGEGWTGGSTPLDAGKQATKANIKKITATAGSAGSVAVFNDVIRDGLKGGVFNAAEKGYISGVTSNASKVLFGIKGGSTAGHGFTVNNAMVINYMSAHDNHTLWDKLTLSCPNASDAEKIEMNKFGAAILMISKGTPFMQAGEEMLRTKGGDENSYKSGDAVNNIDWESLTATSEQYKMVQYYQGLLALRNSLHALTAKVSAINGTNDSSGIIRLTFEDPTQSSKKVYVVINPTSSAITQTLPTGEWHLYANGESASTSAIKSVAGTDTVASRSVHIYANYALN